MPKIILFTGHRNKLAEVRELYNLYQEFPNAVWLHGGAKGFDSQVDTFAKQNGIQRIIVPPPYKYPGDTSAPILRNALMLDMAELVVALFDGRKKGGTFYTINRAKDLGKPVRYISEEGLPF